MLYVCFLLLAILYNIKKFRKERDVFISSLVEAKNSADREMILGHGFYIYIFESFLAFIVAHLISENSWNIGILGLGITYLSLFFIGLFFYQFFIRYLEKQTGLELYEAFRKHVIKEIRVSFSMIMLPILVYSIINWAVMDDVDGGSGIWFVGTVVNVIFVSILTIVCSVIIMLRLIPNREISEPEYLDIINKRLAQIGEPNMRVRWIEADIKNAFVVGLKLFMFSNQTMFIGRSLRKTLTLEEFDAVVCHELAHVANRHIQKRILSHVKMFLGLFVGVIILNLLVFVFAGIYWDEMFYLHLDETVAIGIVCSVGWIIFNYISLFDGIRSHEYEADAYAVIEMGADLNCLKSALLKITSTENVPEYLKRKQKPKKKTFWGKYFATHPEISDRISSVAEKIKDHLPYNYYVSPSKKIRLFLGHLFNWRVTGFALSVLVVMGFWINSSIRDGVRTIAYIESASREELLKDKDLLVKINNSPYILGSSYMYYIVKKKDVELLDHFMENGADKGRSLIYLTGTKDLELLKRYYTLYQDELSEGEYFLMLRNAAERDFTEGYRLLVNAHQFEKLSIGYKEDISSLHTKRDRKRSPASK